MGIEPYQVTSSVGAILNQRLVRKLCAKCRTKDAAGGFKPAGCDECFNTGFRGRALVAEIAEMTSQLRKAILAKADIEQLDEMIKQTSRSMLDDSLALVEQGITTREELDKVCPVTERKE